MNKLTKKELILGSLNDLVLDFLVYNRKNDQNLKLCDIEKALRDKEVTIEDLVTSFEKELKFTLDWDIINGC